MKRLVGYFFQGLIFIAPVSITFYIIYLIIRFLNGLIVNYIDPVLPFQVPGLGFVVVIFIIAFMGFIGQSIIAHPFMQLFNRLMEKTPLVKIIYSSIRDLLSAFVGKEKKFNQPALVKVNHISNLEKIGFITEEDLSELGIEGKKSAVYFPHSYNFSGELFIVPNEFITKLDIPASDAMKFVVSGGVTKV